MESRIRVAAVSYLNTKPLVYGFEKGAMKDSIDMVFEYPSKVASLLVSGQVDAGLVPVAVIPQLSESHIIADYGISADGEVASVCLFSDVPLEKIEKIYLDYQSRTSVALCKILLKHHWKINPQLIAAQEGFEKNIRGNVAGVVIGDRALSQRKNSKYIYDLSTAWKNMTGLPFIFAAWVSNKKLPDDLVAEFNKSTSEGLEHIAEIVQNTPFPDYDLQHYYKSNINYRLGEREHEGRNLFLKMLQTV